MERKALISFESTKKSGIYSFVVPNNAPIGEAIEFLQEIDVYLSDLIKQNAEETKKKIEEESAQKEIITPEIV